MKIHLSDKIIAWSALISGLTISAVAVWYSVAGLVSIFAAAATPIIIMGVALEVSKLVATVWLKINWSVAPRLIKTYLIIAITILMMITSMGIFGFLSKAHLDQAVPTGDVADKVALIDEKIRTQRENVDAARKALRQMDDAVDQTMARSSDEKGADKAAALRRQQQKERTALQADIAKAQKEIAVLNEERAPIAKELRKVEAEVGPIKYIAALVYGDDPDQNLLEKAVRWVIIIIVIVFDPLAVILLLASQYSFQWFRKQEEETNDEKEVEDFFTRGRLIAKGLDADEDRRIAEEANAKLAEIEREPDIEATLASLEKIEDKPKSINDFVPQPQTLVVDEEPVVENTVAEDQQIIDEALETEKEAMRLWKEANPNDSLKHQRRLFEKGIITRLPWQEYLKAKPDYTPEQEAAIEAAKWAQEQLDQSNEAKKKDSDLDGETGQGTDQKDQRGINGYQQNAEQNERTLWQRIQDAKK